MGKESIVRNLAKFADSISYQKLEEKVTHRVKNLILDAIGTAIGGREMPWSRIALEQVKNNRGNATIFTYNLRVPTEDAAFANSVFTNAMALDDFLFAFHPGQVNVPTAIALAEQEDSSGAELIGAVVAGYEMMGRIYLGGPSIVPRFRGVPVFGPFGAATVAGKLLKLNEDQLTNALAYAAHSSSGLLECWITGTMEGYFHGGMAARNGIMAASLAKKGAIASEKTLEGNRGFYQAFDGTTKEVDNVLLDIGKRYLTLEVTYKSYPVCALQQIPIDLSLRLVREHHIRVEDIKQITEKVSEADIKYPGSDNPGPFQKPSQTRLSAQFCAAAAFLGRPVTSHSFYINNLDDPEIVALAKKVILVSEKGREVPGIAVTLNNGKTYAIEEDERQGTLIPTDEKIRNKFGGLTFNFLGEKRANEVIDIVMSLERVSNLRELTSRLVPF